MLRRSDGNASSLQGIAMQLEDREIEPGRIEGDILKAIKESGLNCNRWHLRRDSKRFAFCKKTIRTDIEVAFDIANKYRNERGMNNFFVYMPSDDDIWLVNRHGKVFAICKVES